VSRIIFKQFLSEPEKDFRMRSQSIVLLLYIVMNVYHSLTSPENWGRSIPRTCLANIFEISKPPSTFDWTSMLKHYLVTWQHHKNFFFHWFVIKNYQKKLLRLLCNQFYIFSLPILWNFIFRSSDSVLKTTWASIFEHSPTVASFVTFFYPSLKSSFFDDTAILTVLKLW
jgi:hypothetical protein